MSCDRYVPELLEVEPWRLALADRFGTVGSQKKRQSTPVNKSSVEWWKSQKNKKHTPEEIKNEIVIRNYLQRYCLGIIEYVWFDRVVLALILINSLCMAAQDPRSQESRLTVMSELLFNSAFTLEMCLKLIALGLGPYFYDPWNRFDLITVVCGWLPLSICLSHGHGACLNGTEVINITFLRVVRIVKVLKSVQRIPGMRCLVLCLVKSFPLLMQVMEVLLFIFFCFAAIGVQLFNGTFRQQCLNKNTGQSVDPFRTCTKHTHNFILSGNMCGQQQFCSDRDFKGRPNTRVKALHRYISFDNILLGFTTVLSTVSLEGWSPTLYALMDALGPIVIIYFVLLVLIGSYFVINLIVAVVYQAYVAVEASDLADACNIVSSTSNGTTATDFWWHFHQHHQTSCQKSTDREDDVAWMNVLDYSKSSNTTTISTLDRIGWRPRPQGQPHGALIPDRSAEIVAKFGCVEEDNPFIRRDGKVEDHTINPIPPDPCLPYRRCLTKYWWALRDISCFICSLPIFEQSIMICIIGNTLLLLIEHASQPISLSILDCVANKVLTAIFVFEMVLKMLGTKYIFDPDDGRLNLFEGALAIGSVLDLVVEAEIGTGKCNAAAFRDHDNMQQEQDTFLKVSRMLRLFRIFRCMRIVRKWKSMSHILSAVVRSGPGLLNFSFLLIIFSWVYALAGMQMYAGQFTRLVNDQFPSYLARPRTNFDSLASALITVFITVSGENWDSILNLAYKVNGYIGIVFIVSMYLIGNFIVLNIFLAILLSNFETALDTSNLTLYDELEQSNELVSFFHAVIRFFKRLQRRSYYEQTSEVSTIRILTRYVRTKAARLIPTAAPKVWHVATPLSSDHSVVRGVPQVRNGIGKKSQSVQSTSLCLSTLVEHMQAEVPVGIHHRGRNEYHDCFTGTSAVDWMLDVGIATDSDDAIRIGQMLVTNKFIRAVEANRILSRKKICHQQQSFSRSATLQRMLSKKSTLQNISRSARSSMERGAAHFFTSDNSLQERQRPTSVRWHQNYEEDSAYLSNLPFDDTHQLYRFCARAAHRLEIIGDPEQTKVKRIENKHRDRQASKIKMLNTGDSSLFVFSARNPFRVWCAKVIADPRFDMAVVLMIILSSVMLAATNPRGHASNSQLAEALKIGDWILTFCFLLELLLKVIAETFLQYLQSGWNILDFFIVAVSILSWLLQLTTAQAANLSYLKALRAVRALRPLRMIKRYPAMKTVVDALMESVPDVLNVSLVVAGFFCVFAVAGGTLFRGILDFCHVTRKSPEECADWNANCNYRYVHEHELQFAVLWSRYNIGQSQCRTYWKERRNSDGGLPWSILPSKYISNSTATMASPLKAEWMPASTHFDNLGAALLALFEIATLEGWPGIMFSAMDATHDDEAPPKRNAAAASALFFVIFVIIGSFFVMNIFVGVVVHKFQVAKERTNGTSAFLSQQQRDFVERLKTLLDTGRPQILRIPDTSSRWRLNIFNLVISERFEFIIMLCIVLNMIAISINHYNQSKLFDRIDHILNIVFTFIFLIELGLKHIGLGLQQYWKDGWNRFDAFIVMIATIDTLLTSVSPKTNIAGGLNLSLFRILRLVRVVKLVNVNEGLKMLLKSLLVSLPSLMNVGSLLVLLIFVYACIGMNLYHDVKHDEYITKYCNFDTFGYSMLTLFRCLTGEDWNKIMQSIVNDGGRHSAYAFFSSYMLLGNFMMLNLCVAVILEAFAEFMEADAESEKKRQELRNNVSAFKTAWLQQDKDNSMFIPMYRIVALLHDLPPALSFSTDKNFNSNQERTQERRASFTSEILHNHVAQAAVQFQQNLDASSSFNKNQSKITVNRYLYSSRLDSKQRDIIDHVRSLRIKVNENQQLFYLDVLTAVLHKEQNDVDFTAVNDHSSMELSIMLLRSMDKKLRHKMTVHSFRCDLPELDLTHAINAAVSLQEFYRSVVCLRRVQSSWLSSNSKPSALCCHKNEVFSPPLHLHREGDEAPPSQKEEPLPMKRDERSGHDLTAPPLRFSPLYEAETNMSCSESVSSAASDDENDDHADFVRVSHVHQTEE